MCDDRQQASEKTMGRTSGPRAGVWDPKAWPSWAGKGARPVSYGARVHFQEHTSATLEERTRMHPIA